MPVVTVPFPSAQLVPVNVTVMSKIFLPLGRGETVPDELQPIEPGELTAPEGEIVTGVLCTELLPETPCPAKEPAIAASDAGSS